MSCPTCGHENRPGRKFCGECGAKLALVCAVCSAPYEPSEKFCGECGAALGASGPSTAAARPLAGADPTAVASDAPPGRAALDADARKVVTIVFADLVGSTALHERLDAESARRVMERYYAALRRVVDMHGGAVVKLLGDGVMAAFGLKQVAEDDALRAVRAAAAMQDAFRVLVSSEVVALGGAGLRVGVNTGEVVVSGARDDVIGDPVNVAARLQEQGRDGDVVIGEATRRLVATGVTLAALGSITLKGRAEAVAAYRLVSLEPPAGATAAPFVGREAELAQLETVYGAAVTTPATRLAVLLGSPGLGKSRLIDELTRRHAADATILTAHCDATGGATFAPLAQALRGFLGLDDGAVGDPVRAAVVAALPSGDDTERARIAGGIDGLLTGAATSPEETFFVVRRFLAGLASAKPLVLVIDDLHWAEPLLLDLVEHLVQWGSGVPLFVLIGARPELRDVRSTLVTPGTVVTDVLTLGGLDAGAAMRLAANVIGAADLPAAVAAKVLATSEGNPLFVGELVRMLVQEGALTKDGERWIVGAGLASLEMPPTIHALLAARIERLGADDRHVLERAAVVGRHFSRSAVAALIQRNGGDQNAREAGELDARLESLRRSELIERDTGWLLGEPVLRFHHVLIRDAAYRRLLKGTRAELHERLADWIEGRVGDAPEHDELVGWHLEQAHQHLRELGPLDAAAIVLGERAARRLAAAGRRALARDDVALAASLLGRALERLTADAPERADLVLDWCEALLAAGDVGPAAAAIAALEHLAVDSSRLRAWHTCFAGQLTVLTAPDELHTAAERVGAAAGDLAGLEDAAGEAKAHFVHAQALARLGKIGACEVALDLALAAARRAGDRRRANAVLAGAPLAALWGPSPVTRASGRCLDVVRVLRITQGAPAVEAVALSCQGVLEALRGRTDAARRMLASSRTMVEELGIAHRLFETDVFAGRVDLLEGNAPAAERALRAGYEGLRQLGLGIDAARAAALLGRALLAQDRAAEAETLSHESELLAGDDLQAAIAWRGVRAEALARRGEPAAAIELAEAAVAIAAATDALLDHADARLALAAAMRAAGRRTEADAEERRAFELWEAKGATVLADRARDRVASAASSPAAEPPGTAPPPATGRRLTSNAATRSLAVFDAAFAAGDLAPWLAIVPPDLLVIDHPTETTYGRDGAHASYDRLLRMKDARVRHEPLATLGDSLGLCRRSITAAGSDGGRFDVGAFDREEIVLVDTGLAEIFAADRLGAAMVVLYERYADGLLAGVERERAAATARTVAATMTPTDVEGLVAVLAPDVENVDHRTISTWSARGPEAIGAHMRSLRDVATDIVFSVDEILRLEREAMLLRRTHRGTDRGTGGTYEREFLQLIATNADGRCARVEWFDVDQVADALARFDVLTTSAAPQAPVRRRLRPNAATRGLERFWAAIGARDDAAVGAAFAADLRVVHHSTRATYGRRAMLAAWRSMMRAGRLDFHSEILASLGDTLVLERHTLALEGFTEAHLAEFGRSELDEVVVIETDEHGQWCHCEIFAADRLRNAIGRLMERHAESLPEGPARRRASAIAGAGVGSEDLIEDDRALATLAPTFECVDHRTLGTWSTKGREGWRTHLQYQAELAAGFSVRADDVLAFEPGASVVRQTFFGTSVVSGGAFENVVLMVTTFDADGLVARIELFEPDQQAAALACFDALTAGAAPTRAVQRRVRPNTGIAAMARFDAAFAAADLDAIAALYASSYEEIDHFTEVTYGLAGMLASLRRVLRSDGPRSGSEPLATLGDRLVLTRRTITTSGTRGERDWVSVLEVDERGRFTRNEAFTPDHLADAVVRIYERYAAQRPEGAERERAGVTARAVAFMLLPGEAPGGVEAFYSPAYEDIDHRTVGYGKISGPELGNLLRASLGEVADDLRYRLDDVLVLEPHGLVRITTSTGVWREGGGAFERTVCTFNVFDPDGRVLRHETFEAERTDDALARFDALIASPAPQTRIRRRVRPNTASMTWAGIEAAFRRREVSAIDALLADPMTTIEHPTGTTYGRPGQLESTRWMMRLPDLQFRVGMLATLGDLLCLARRTVTASGAAPGARFDVGEFEIESIVLNETDAAGRLTSSEVFAADRLGDAIIRSYERHAELLPEGPARTRAAGTARSSATHSRSATDPDRFAAALAPTIDAVDHRTVGFGTLQGRDAVVAAVRALLDLSADVSWQTEDVLALSEHASLVRTTQRGRERRSGGEWERPILSLRVHDADGLIARWEIFEPEREAEAVERYEVLMGDDAPAPAPPEPPFANAATRGTARLTAYWHARDWDGFARMLSPDFRFDDRRSMSQVVLDREGYVAFARELGDMASRRQDTKGLATRGERLTLGRVHLALADGDVGPSELEYLYLWEIDERDLGVAAVTFDVADLAAAYAELDRRYEAGEAAAFFAAPLAFARAVIARNWDALAALCAPTFVQYDHRPFAILGTTHGGDAWERTLRTVVELAPDTQVRVDHVRHHGRGFLMQMLWQGSREGGPYEIPVTVVIELNEHGKIVCNDLYAHEQLDEIRMRFAELAALDDGRFGTRFW